MVLKLKLDVTKGSAWKILDNITGIDTHFDVDKETIVHYDMIMLSNDKEKESTIWKRGVFLNCEIDGDRCKVYTELPAYLLNDKGETIERLN